MRAIMTAIAIFAVANLIGLAGFGAWLRSSGRIDAERLRKIREVLTEPIAAEKARLEAEQAKAEAQAREDEAAERRSRPPLTSEQQLVLRLLSTDTDRQRTDRLSREVGDLKKTLADEISRLEATRAALAAERQAFEELQRQTQELAGSAQFRKAVGVLEGLKPAESKATLAQVLEGSIVNEQGKAERVTGTGGAPAPLSANATMSAPAASAPRPVPAGEAGLERVVTYLNALQERTRNRVMSEFIKDDPALAARLLERLRNHGVLAGSAGTTP